ncbi:ectoine/hydroxyectoine ABC transporter substrate-binding protein EhuB [Streptomyces sp. NPDC017979]|uniref:ectoine/hydroxyectoine ABC transporter substrate-binding protein EhuB n=1 Tax=Streptomyces sp. NPDC017979 TaxID=3365024 RepID=UPI00379A9B1C
MARPQERTRHGTTGNTTRTTAHEEPQRPRIGRRSLLTGAAALGTLGVLGSTTACSRVSTAGESGGGGLLEQLRAKGTVRLGLAGEQPYGYIGTDGKMTGSAPVVARRIFKELGVEDVQPFPTEFGSLITGLNSLQFDVVGAGMFITPVRCEQVIFSDPEYQSVSGFLVPKGNPKNLRSFEDVAKSGARFSTAVGYAEIDYAKEAGIKSITTLPDQLAGRLAIEQGRADVFAGTIVAVRNVAKGSSRVEATAEVTPYVDGEPVIDVGGFAFRTPETDLRDAFNRELHKLKRSGELLELMRPFGFGEAQMTTIRAKERCAP